MANVTTNRGVVTYSLELSEAEAKSLYAVTAGILGSGPARVHMDDIHAALVDADVAWPDNEVTFSNAIGDEVEVSGGDAT